MQLLSEAEHAAQQDFRLARVFWAPTGLNKTFGFVQALARALLALALAQLR